LQLSPAILKKLRMPLSCRKKSVVPAESRSTAPEGWAGAPQRLSRQLTGNRKDNELASSGDSFESVNRRTTNGPRLCPRVHWQSRANKMLRAADNSVRPGVGRRTRLS
jgi:hypothetical protein